MLLILLSTINIGRENKGNNLYGRTNLLSPIELESLHIVSYCF